MKKIIEIVFIGFLVLTGTNSIAQELQAIDYVDPMIGTDAHGHTFPGATTPFGMVQLSPSNDFKAWDWCSGYHYSDSVIKGFAHTHISGAGLAGLGDILFMPTTGELNVNPGSDEEPDSGYRSRFSHKKEEASAGYYSVFLDDYQVKVELTASPRVGFHRYTSSDGGNLNIIIDPTHQIMEQIINTEVQIVSDSVVRGYKRSKGEAGDRYVYFYAHFSKPAGSFGVAKDNKLFRNEEKANGMDTKAYLSFDMAPNESMEVKVGISHVSYQGAKMNLKFEASDMDFDNAHMQARKSWSDKLSKIEIEGASAEQKRIFYTGLYHAYISPNIFSDVDSTYQIGGKEYHSEFPHYSTFSTWDTYRALHPLFTIIEQDKTSDFVNSLVSRHFDSKVGLPIWELLGFDNACMIGYNTVSPMADAVLKGIDGIDNEKVFQAIKAAAYSSAKNSPNYDRNGIEEYLLYNYVPGEIGSSVSKTTEQNYYDWCISQVAKKLGYEDDETEFAKRSIGYRSLFNIETKYLHPKYTTDEWREINTSTWNSLKNNYVSGNIWGYSSYVPHDVEGLIYLMGGHKEFAGWLDNIIADTSSIKGTTHVDISGFIGKYGHGDEPSHHLPYLYNYAGQPWKTQELVRQVMSEFYSDKPDGLVNNEDLGQMSAWYIFSSLGFYPVCPGDLKYIIGSPLYGKSTIKLENGKSFTVIAKNSSPENKYIQSARLNGEELTRSFITHHQIMSGGILEFTMGDRPNRKWGSQASDIPASTAYEPGILPKANLTFKPFDPDMNIVFEGSKTISLKCNTPNAEIFYTLDGSEPSKNSKKYISPFEIHSSTTLKAIAFASDLNPSLIFDKAYFKGRSFNEIEGFPVISLKIPPGSYGEKDGSQLIDREIGSAHFGDGQWTGWDGQDMIATIDFGKETSFENVSVGFLSAPTVWIFPPESIEVYISSDNESYTKLIEQDYTIEKENADKSSVTRDVLDLEDARGRYLRVVVKNMKVIPDWHAASGHAPWMFVDEILIN